MTTTAPPSGLPAAVPAPGVARGSRRRLPPRLAFLLRRLVRLAVSLAVVVVATFFIIQLVPGDPVRAALGPSATPELVEATRVQLGLDKPVPVQFVDYVTGLLTGDLGVSIKTQRSVADIIAQRFPPTLALAASAFVVAALGALPIGLTTAIWSRSGRHRIRDAVVSVVIGVLIAVPNFLIAVGLVALFAVQLRVLPAAGWGEPVDAVLPVLALALGPMAYLARIVHVEMLNVLGSTYMTTARAKRLPSRIRYFRHALPNTVTASLTVGGMLLSGLTAATVLIEAVFAIPGLGFTTITSVAGKDYPMVQGVVIVFALMVLGVNLLVDLILVTIDPRSSIAEG